MSASVRELAVSALKRSIDGATTKTSFSQLLRDIQSMQEEEEDRIAELREHHASLRAAVQRAIARMAYAELDADRRTWTESERDEMTAAEAEHDEAAAELLAFEAAHLWEIRR
jgi:hypothetical protein